MRKVKRAAAGKLGFDHREFGPRVPKQSRSDSGSRTRDFVLIFGHGGPLHSLLKTGNRLALISTHVHSKSDTAPDSTASLRQLPSEPKCRPVATTGQCAPSPTIENGAHADGCAHASCGPSCAGWKRISRSARCSGSARLVPGLSLAIAIARTVIFAAKRKLFARVSDYSPQIGKWGLSGTMPPI